VGIGAFGRDGVGQWTRNCPKFLENPDLLGSPPRVCWAVGGETLRTFSASVDETAPDHDKKYERLFLLCEEFGFTALLLQISELRSERAVIDDEARERVCRIEEQNRRQSRALF
jgi:hypothetical protein